MSSNEGTLGGDALSMLVAALQGMQAELARLTASNLELSARLEKLAEKVEPTRKETRDERRKRLEFAAISALSTVGPVIARVAKEVGVPVRTLAGWPVFMRAMELAQGNARQSLMDRQREAQFSGDE